MPLAFVAQCAIAGTVNDSFYVSMLVSKLSLLALSATSNPSVCSVWDIGSLMGCLLMGINVL